MTFEQFLDEEISIPTHLADAACNVEMALLLKQVCDAALENPWQDIEAAPKDGAVVDIYSKSLGRLCNYKRVKIAKDMPVMRLLVQDLQVCGMRPIGC